ncbi:MULTISPECIES: class I SAM-dependent methyltransferase [unclassified Ruegeria]|uniref:class I SAM-dependent methyltransferase n=1 Tax=unclassified Ruegeria TaxID=2625375 RepID=UPI001AE94EBE|nr:MULTISPECIES: class I SAM-dependent methyltransferase [unclassified Ruegeria]
MATVSQEISKNDEMYLGDNAHYFSCGANAFNEIQVTLGELQPEKILDLPCGHGRVTRYLVANYPSSEVFVADLNEDGARFCKANFGTKMLLSSTDFSTLNFGMAFDLIWVGSLITHLDADTTKAFFGFVARHLTARGRAVVTTHGALVAGRVMRRGASVYGIEAEEENAMCMDYFATGYGYRDYPNATSYGISICSEAWVRAAVEEVGLQVVRFKNHAWDNHQDVYGLALSN